MIVCHCKGISDRAIREAIRQGALTRTEVARTCNAGGGCKGCHPLIDSIIDQEGGVVTASAGVKAEIGNHAY